MKISSFFNLLTDLIDWNDLFEEVESREQLVSRLERLKHRPDDVLALLHGSRLSVEKTMGDTLEMSPDLGEPDVLEDGDLDKELDALVDDKAISEENLPTENVKKDVEPIA